MAEQFDVKQILETVIRKVDGLADDVRTNSFKLDRLEQTVGNVEGKLDQLTDDVRISSGQFNDVGRQAIKDSGRIHNLEKRVDDLEANIH